MRQRLEDQAPCSRVHLESLLTGTGEKAPNTKFQAPKKLQGPTSKRLPQFPGWWRRSTGRARPKPCVPMSTFAAVRTGTGRLELGIFLELGFWGLELPRGVVLRTSRPLPPEPPWKWGAGPHRSRFVPLGATPQTREARFHCGIPSCLAIVPAELQCVAQRGSPARSNLFSDGASRPGGGFATARPDRAFVWPGFRAVQRGERSIPNGTRAPITAAGRVSGRFPGDGAFRWRGAR